MGGLGMALQVVQVVKKHSSWVKDMKIGNLAYQQGGFPGFPVAACCLRLAGQSSEFAENKSESSQGSSSRPWPDPGEFEKKDRPPDLAPAGPDVTRDLSS